MSGSRRPVEGMLRLLEAPRPPEDLRGRVLDAARRAERVEDERRDILELVWRWRHAVVAALVLLLVAHASVTRVAHVWGRAWGWEAEPTAPSAVLSEVFWENQ